MREVVDISVVLVPVLEEGDNRVDKEEEHETEDEDLLETDMEVRGGDDQWRFRIVLYFISIIWNTRVMHTTRTK